MSSRRLDVDFVTKLDRRLSDGGDAAPLQACGRTTVGGLLSLACLADIHPDVDLSLPNDLERTPALRAVRRGLPDLTLGETVRPMANLSTQSEPLGVFPLLPGFAMTDHALGAFCLRFRHAINAEHGRTTLRRRADLIEAAIRELIENVARHAGTARPAVVGYEVTPRSVAFGVFDLGRGAAASLRQNPEYAAIVEDLDALRLVIQPGVSADPAAGGGGTGYRQVFKALADAEGHVWMRSGNAVSELRGKDIRPDVIELNTSVLPDSRVHQGRFQVAVGYSLEKTS